MAMMRTVACSCLLLCAYFTHSQQLDASLPGVAGDTTPVNAMAIDSVKVAEVMRALEKLPKRVYTYNNLPPVLHGHGSGLEPLTRNGDFDQEGRARWLEEHDRTILEPPLCTELRERIEALEERLRLLGTARSDKPTSPAP